jgi:hypothetical protein
MTYIKVIWHHEFRNEPVTLYSELDDQRFEVRKVELFSDGRTAFSCASDSSSSPYSQLGLVPIPDNTEIARDSQFEIFEIEAEEFDLVWKSARIRAMQPN